MISLNDTRRGDSRGRFEEPSTRLYLWVVGAIVLLQVFPIANTLFQQFTFLNDRLDMGLSSKYLWTIVPLRLGSWLLLIPFIAAVIVFARSSLITSASAHLMLIVIATLLSGLFLHRAERVQADQVMLLLNGESSLDRERVAGTPAASSQKAKVDPTQDTTERREKNYKLIARHNSDGMRYWIVEGLTNVITYSAMIAAGYAVLYFRLTQYRTQQAERLRATMLQLRHESLCNRLTPHFLFNTLNTISSLTLADSEAARACISQLGELLRASIEALPEREIRLERELEILQIYLSIQQTRFGPALKYEFDVEAGLESAIVPAFLLQPLVENCFKHGFRERQRPAFVQVSVKQENGYCRMAVTDNGTAFDVPKMLDEKYGLGITRQRLELQYGGDADLRYEANQPRGLTVIARVPLRFEVHQTT